ncbi:hypothetical protein, partial [Salmonella sp. s59944]|uniref:hypothetical protein n=1 Tax=Salmonella sp. s59944 TaxID=3159720 RepID=UPI00397EFA2A
MDLWFGSGSGTFRFVEASRDESIVSVYTHPHNIVAEIFFDTGLVGVAIFSLSLVIGLCICLQTSFKSAEPIGLLASIWTYSLGASF